MSQQRFAHELAERSEGGFVSERSEAAS